MEGLAKQEDDKRVQFGATKDLLDRAGTRASEKHEFYTPDDYARRRQELLDEGLEMLRQEKLKELTDGPEPDTDSGTS